MANGGGAYRLADFEGLVFTTARIYAARVGMEPSDLEQELRVRVWRANETFDPAKVRSRDPVKIGNARKRYVFSAIANKVKDFKRDAARRAVHGVTFVHVAEEDQAYNSVGPEIAARALEIPRDEVFGAVDAGLFTIPAGVTEPEVRVLLMLMMDFTRPEVAVRLAITVVEVDRRIMCLRGKLADWRPSLPGNESRTVTMADALGSRLPSLVA